MAFEAALTCVSFPSSGNLASSQYLFCNVNSSGLLEVNTTAGGVVDGVLQDAPGATGREGSLALLSAGGISKVVAGGNITAGGNVSSSNAGKAVASTTNAAILGKALEAGADGRIISVAIGYRGASA